MLKLKVEPCQGHSDCLYVMVARPYWCDCEVMDNLPNIYDGEDEDEEADSLHHGNCFIWVQSRPLEKYLEQCPDTEQK